MKRNAAGVTGFIRRNRSYSIIEDRRRARKRREKAEQELKLLEENKLRNSEGDGCT